MGSSSSHFLSGWTTSDVVTLVACLLAIPPAAAAGYALLKARVALCARRQGKLLFPRVAVSRLDRRDL